LGGVLEICLLVGCEVIQLVVFLIFQRQAATVTIGNNNKHHGQKLTFISSLPFTKITPLHPKEM